MDEPGAPAASPQTTADRGTRLDSWKEIAAYLNRDLRTLQRWEKTANLPIRRLNKPGMRAVFAYTADLDDWLRQQSPTPSDIAPEDRSVTPAPTAAAAPVSRRPSRAVTASAVVIVLAIVAVTAFLIARRAPLPFEVLTSRPITADPGSERDPDISPDGNAIAYAAVAPTLRTRILVRLFDGGEPRALTSAPDNEWSPVWSPDGLRIAFLRGDPERGTTLFVTSALGGEERKIADVRPYPRRRTNLIGHLLAWAPDSRHVIVPDRAMEDGSRLFLIDTTTGERRPLTSPAPREVDVEPSITSDGRTLLFNRVRGELQSHVFVQRLGAGYAPDGPARQLPSSAAWNGTPRPLESRGEVLTSAGNIPRLSLWRQPIDGSALPVSLGIIGDNATQSAVHQASGRIVSRTYRAQNDVLRFAMPDAPTAAPADPPVQAFLESTFIDRNPVYSPDGSRVVFISDRTGLRQLWVATDAGKSPTQLKQDFETDLPAPSWSPDGSKIAFPGISASGWSQLFVVDVATRVAKQLTNDTLEYGHAEWSTDGRFLYAAASDKTRYRLYKVPASGGAAELMVAEHGAIRGVAPGDAGLYVVGSNARNQTNLSYLPLPKGPAVHLASMNFGEDAWVTPKGVYYLARRGDGPLAPVALSFRTHDGLVTVLQEYTRPPGRGLSVSADGRYALTTRVVPPISDLLLLETSK